MAGSSQPGRTEAGMLLDVLGTEYTFVLRAISSLIGIAAWGSHNSTEFTFVRKWLCHMSRYDNGVIGGRQQRAEPVNLEVRSSPFWVTPRDRICWQ